MRYRVMKLAKSAAQYQHNFMYRRNPDHHNFTKLPMFYSTDKIKIDIDQDISKEAKLKQKSTELDRTIHKVAANRNKAHPGCKKCQQGQECQYPNCDCNTNYKKNDALNVHMFWG